MVGFKLSHETSLVFFTDKKLSARRINSTPFKLRRFFTNSFLILFKSFKNGVVHVELQGSCSGCPSSLMTLKQGVQNLLCHYVEEVKSVEAI